MYNPYGHNGHNVPPSQGGGPYGAGSPGQQGYYIPVQGQYGQPQYMRYYTPGVGSLGLFLAACPLCDKIWCLRPIWNPVNMLNRRPLLMLISRFRLRDSVPVYLTTLLAGRFADTRHTQEY